MVILGTAADTVMTDSVYKGEDFEDKVRKQVEFYFSDSNLQTDKFLWKIYEANDGWVELKTILTFSRMRQYRPEDRVISALKQSEKLVLSANEDMIRRKDPLKDFNEIKNNRKRNTVHIEGFPKDIDQEQMEAWFNDKIAPELPNTKAVASVRRVKSRAKREFFGVVDVEFKTNEDTQFILNDVELLYPSGIAKKDDESIDKKEALKKMSLLTFQEMRESGKRFGVNEVTKRRNSFNDNRGNKKFKKGKKFEKKNGSAVEEESDAQKQESSDKPQPAEQTESSEKSENPEESVEKTEKAEESSEKTEKPEESA